MAVKKCPMCGGDVVGDVCFSCGFELPNEAEMTSERIPEPKTVYAESFTDTKCGYVPPPRVKIADEGESPSYLGYESEYSYSYGSFEDFCDRYNKMSFSEKMGKYWWAMLILLLLPAALPLIAGIILTFAAKTPAVRKFAGSVIILGVISLFVFG
ncbi:MAG: hypothetical protein LBL87_07535 [Ruminococcus sp.]|jgi:hypothetical protein|nr:hypothetical protein [Ruminococcus sp.]